MMTQPKQQKSNILNIFSSPSLFFLSSSLSPADLVLFCFSAANEWTLSSLEHSVSHAIKERQSAAPKKKASRFKKASPTPTPTNTDKKAPLPLIAVQLFSERGDLPQAKAMLAPHTKTILKASALEGYGINEVFQACAEALVANEKEHLSASSAPSADVPAGEETPAVVVVSKEKEGIAALWGKLMAKFVSGKGGEEAALVQQTPVDAAPVA